MKNYKIEETTMWKFEERGNWSTHRGDYRGNWSPHIPRNIILRYSQSGQLILDPFVGSGTTVIEAKLLGRRSIGIDINQNALDITEDRINFDCPNSYKPLLFLSDATNMVEIADDSVDLICSHPPYSNIIKYSLNNPLDLSLKSYNDFLLSIDKFAKECLRVLKSNGTAAVMVGDVRINGTLKPLGLNLLHIFLSNDFALKDIVIKEQFNCHRTSYWKSKNRHLNFLLLAHEYIFILKKKSFK